MNRVHPQTANAPEAKPRMFVNGIELVGERGGGLYDVRLDLFCDDAGIEQVRRSYGMPIALEVGAQYGLGVPPGEAFSLTDAQVAEWKRDQ